MTQRAILDALEAKYPMLRGTIRDHTHAAAAAAGALLRLPAGPLARIRRTPRCPKRWQSGKEAYMVVGAMAGG